MVLEKLRRRRKLKVTDLTDWRIHGGPVPMKEVVSIPFMQNEETTPRSIVWKTSGDSNAIVWKIAGKTDFQVFTDREKAAAFYNEKMRQLRAEMLKEVEEIRARLDQEFTESWKDAKRVYFYRGFKIKAILGEKPAKINRKFLGLLEGRCPECGELQCFDGRQAFTNFLTDLDLAKSEEAWATSHQGLFSSSSQPVRSRCPNCRTYPTLELEGQANKSLLREMTRRLRK